MKKTINRSQFIQAFSDAGRGEQFSRDALSAIFDWIENYEDDAGEQIELDVIAICCEWAEDSPEDIAYEHAIELDDSESSEEKAQRVMDHLELYSPAAIELDSGKIVYIQF